MNLFGDIASISVKGAKKHIVLTIAAPLDARNLAAVQELAQLAEEGRPAWFSWVAAQNPAAEGEQQ